MSRPTYEDIKEKVFSTTGLKIHHTCWIAEVMRKYGLTNRTAWNSGKGRGSPQCPAKHFKAIEDALKEYEMIE